MWFRTINPKSQGVEYIQNFIVVYESQYLEKMNTNSRLILIRGPPCPNLGDDITNLGQ